RRRPMGQERMGRKNIKQTRHARPHHHVFAYSPDGGSRRHTLQAWTPPDSHKSNKSRANPTRGPALLLVEMAGIEPASACTNSDLLRAQPEKNFSAPPLPSGGKGKGSVT